MVDSIVKKHVREHYPTAPGWVVDKAVETASETRWKGGTLDAAKDAALRTVQEEVGDTPAPMYWLVWSAIALLAMMLIALTSYPQ